MPLMLMVAMMAAEPIDCPPVGSAARDRLKLAGEVCKDEPKPAPVAKAKPFAPRPLTPAEKAEIIGKADQVLFDGASARWQWGPRKDSHLYCGQVNAKNRLGAYVGWRPFYYMDGDIRIIAEGDSTVAYEGLCSISGYIPQPDWLKPKAGQ